MKNLLIVLVIFLAACSSDPNNDIAPLIDRNLSLNNGAWTGDNYTFVAKDDAITDIYWHWDQKVRDAYTHEHTYKFDGDTLRINLRSFGPNDTAYWIDIDLHWKLGEDIVYGYQALKDGNARTSIEFIKDASN